MLLSISIRQKYRVGDVFPCLYLKSDLLYNIFLKKLTLHLPLLFSIFTFLGQSKTKMAVMECMLLKPCVLHNLPWLLLVPQSKSSHCDLAHKSSTCCTGLASHLPPPLPSPCAASLPPSWAAAHHTYTSHGLPDAVSRNMLCLPQCLLSPPPLILLGKSLTPNSRPPQSTKYIAKTLDFGGWWPGFKSRPHQCVFLCKILTFLHFSVLV